MTAKEVKGVPITLSPHSKVERKKFCVIFIIGSV